MTRTALPHLEESLRRGLDLLQEKLLEMATRAEQAHWDALDALKRMDRQAAYLVIFRDQHIDRLETELDRLCIEFMVRQQPAGRHLRFVFSVVKITKELERVGDYAESVARQVLNLAAAPAPELLARLDQLAGVSLPMFKQAVRAFLDSDPGLARSLIHEEVRADRLRREFDGEVTARCRAQEVSTDAYTPLLTVARRLERVSDQARNICEEALYTAIGEYVKHQESDTFTILFAGEDTSGLPAMAECAAASLKLPVFRFSGIGLKAVPMDPGVMQFLQSRGMDPAGYVPKTADTLREGMEIHVVVAFSAAMREAMEKRFDRSLVVEWKIRPVSGQGTEVTADYEPVLQALDGHIRDLVAALQGVKKGQITDV